MRVCVAKFRGSGPIPRLPLPPRIASVNYE